MTMQSALPEEERPDTREIAALKRAEKREAAESIGVDAEFIDDLVEN
ncbi:hypothetical protein [Tsuneonella rigui]|nr:hypothetical protein [Tsuneonella rigui]